MCVCLSVCLSTFAFVFQRKTGKKKRPLAYSWKNKELKLTKCGIMYPVVHPWTMVDVLCPYNFGYFLFLLHRLLVLSFVCLYLSHRYLASVRSNSYPFLLRRHSRGWKNKLQRQRIGELKAYVRRALVRHPSRRCRKGRVWRLPLLLSPFPPTLV